MSKQKDLLTNLTKTNNQKGYGLLEVLVAMTIGLICFAMLGKGLVTYIRTYNYYQKKFAAIQVPVASPTPSPTPVIPGSVPVVGKWLYLPNLNECKQGDSTYYVARTNTRVVTLYTNSNCTGSIGTLDAVNNGGFANDTAKTFWQVSGGNVASPNNLRILILTIN